MGNVKKEYPPDCCINCYKRNSAVLSITSTPELTKRHRQCRGCGLRWWQVVPSTKAGIWKSGFEEEETKHDQRD